jgi:hypothetical protein
MTRNAFVMTARDLEILASLADVRYLTIQHLQWLHWHARWRPAERAAREAGTINRRPKKAYERVAAMAERGLLLALKRSADRATVVFRRLPNAICLTRAGAELLAARQGLPIDQIWHAARSTRAVITLEHSLAIGAFYAALRAELNYRGRTLSGWVADHILCSDYDSLAIAGIGHPLPVIPDGTFALDGIRYFVEIDRGTTRIEQWRKKAMAYQAYQRDPRMQARYGVTSSIILVVAPAGSRLDAIARMVATIHGGVADNYRFLSDDRVHPFSIRRRWQRMAQVEWVVRRAGQPPQPAVTFCDEALWNPTSEEHPS